MNSEQLKVLQPESAHGDFYVEATCCTACGVPQVAAPDLVGWTDSELSQCYWKKQPETTEELEHAFAVFDAQELGCHRYAGHDAKIQARIGRENCDIPGPRRGFFQFHIEPREDEPPHILAEPSFWERFWARFKKT